MIGERLMKPDAPGPSRAEQSTEPAAVDIGVANRSALLASLHAMIESGSGLRTAAFLLMDLNDFREINGTFGHEMGDRLLGQIAGRLRHLIRDGDVLGYMGGDEFGLILPNKGAITATSMARKISAALQVPFLVDGIRINARTSIGVAQFPQCGDTASALLRCADVALYRAKHAHQPYCTYESQHDPHSPERLALIDDLRYAIKHGELVLHYQPKIDVRTGRVDHVEALVRWNHRTQGLLPPARFIPLAEETGLIEPLTYWVLRTALRQCAVWRSAGIDVGVAVNLSAGSLYDPQLIDGIAGVIRSCRVAATDLKVEITETMLVADPDRAMTVLRRLHDMGIGISVDDFGTGYSSLAYLKRLPITEIKIDRSFVTDMTRNANDAVIVHSVIDLGHNLGLEVIAEGVENKETWEHLKADGCDMAQGFYLGRPMENNDLATWIRDWNTGMPAAVSHS